MAYRPIHIIRMVSAPRSHATMKEVAPLRSLSSQSAPLNSSSLATSTCPPWDAIKSGAWPLGWESLSMKATPCWRRHSAQPTCPRSAAINSAVQPPPPPSPPPARCAGKRYQRVQQTLVSSRSTWIRRRERRESEIESESGSDGRKASEMRWGMVLTEIFSGLEPRSSSACTTS